MTRNDQLATVVQLACLTEDRTDAEQRALLAVAARVDREHNKRTVGSKTWDERYLKPVRPLSDLVTLVLGTRCLVDGQTPIAPPKRHKYPRDYLREADEDRPDDGRGPSAYECAECHEPIADDPHTRGDGEDVHAACCEKCREAG